MATFRTFDRLIYAKVESTEGDVNAPNITTDYIETIEPTFTVTNRVYDRNVTRMSVTPAPKHVTGTGRTTGLPSAQCEFSFGVELTGAGATSVTPNDVPWGKLLDACGLKYLDTLTRVPLLPVGIIAGSTPSTWFPWAFRHADQLSVSLAAYDAAHRCGRQQHSRFHRYTAVYAVAEHGGLF